ncbi:MAG: AAA family ATPase [Verrucomicrobia bacterium]|nr:AAA family ATPase [Verrucomicrobiota bacterium]
MPFDNPLLAKLFESILEGRKAEFRDDLLPQEEVEDAIGLLPIPLSRRQHEAVFRAWTHEVSYIQGPPGTGKSHTITAIMLVAIFLKKRVLLVSHKKPAIDVVFQMLRSFLGRGAVVYASNESKQRQTMRGELQEWLAQAGTLQAMADLDQLRRKRAHHRGKVGQLLREIDAIEKSIKDALDWERDYFHRQERFHGNRKDYLSRFTRCPVGEFSLSADADVYFGVRWLDRLQNLLGEMVQSRAGHLPRKEVLHLRRFFGACAREFCADATQLTPNLTAVHYLREHFELTDQFQRANEALARVIPDLLHRTRWTLARKKRELAQQQAELAKAQLKAHVVGQLQESEDDVQCFASMIRNTNPTLIAQKMADIRFPKIIETLPLWVGQMRHLGEFLPFVPELFDLVIVDEASQVNIAEIVPAFYRGSRICVVGDDKQLGLSAAGLFMLNRQFEELIWNRHFPPPNASYVQAEQRSLLVSKHSILDFIATLDGGRVPKTTLDEHFRSYPQLASFTSDTFYEVDGGLRLMKEVPKNLELQCFDCIEVGGLRDPDVKVVQNEVDELMRWLKKLIRQRHYEQDQVLRAHGFGGERVPTLGVISFLTQQRDAIREVVGEEFSPAEQQSCNLLVGTPEDFQGNERDIIFITLGLDGVNKWGRGHYEDRKRFNVATSRAIHYTLLIYGGIPKNARLIKSYLTHFGKTWRSREETGSGEPQPQQTVHRYRWDWNRELHRHLCESEFEHRVADYLEEFQRLHGGPKRIRLFNQVAASRELGVASCGQKRLDFVLLAANGECVAVEVDGRDHFTADGRNYCEAHLERVEILERAGWRIVHVPYYKWWKNGWLCDRDDPQFRQMIDWLFAELREALGLDELVPT